MAKRGRPVEYTPARLEKIRKAIIEYTDESQIPILAEFAYLNNLPRQKLYEFDELRDAIKRLMDKKECQLEIGALTGGLNAPMAIFSLKQLGWRNESPVKESDDRPDPDILRKALDAAQRPRNATRSKKK